MTPAQVNLQIFCATLTGIMTRGGLEDNNDADVAVEEARAVVRAAWKSNGQYYQEPVVT